MRFLPFVLRSLLRSKRRTVLTVLSIVVSLFLFATLRTVLTSFDASLKSAGASRLIVRRSTSLIFPLPLAYRDRLAQVPGVRAVSWSNWFGGVYIDERNFFAQFAVDPRGYMPLYPEYTVTPPEAQDVLERERTACIIGSKLAERFGFRVGQQLTLRGTIYPGRWDFTIRGIARSSSPDLDTNWMLFSWDYLNESVGNPSLVGIYTVVIDDPALAGEVSQAIDRTFANSAAETKTETEKAFQLGFITMLGNIRLVIYAIGTAIVIAILLIAMNTMMMAARERTREIAILKALGFTDRAVLGLVLAESMILGLVGGVLGAGLARVVFALTDFTGGGMFPRFAVTGGTMARAMGIAALLGIVSGTIPALNAARLRIVDALRHAG